MCDTVVGLGRVRCDIKGVKIKTYNLKSPTEKSDIVDLLIDRGSSSRLVAEMKQLSLFDEHCKVLW